MPNMAGAFIMLGVVCGFVGWGFIEFVLWAFGNLTISWG